MFPLASIDVLFWAQADYPTVDLTKEVEPIFEPLLMLMNFDALTQLSSEQFGAWDGITLEDMTLTGTPDKKPEDSPHTGVSGKTMPILLLLTGALSTIVFRKRKKKAAQ